MSYDNEDQTLKHIYSPLKDNGPSGHEGCNIHADFIYSRLLANRFGTNESIEEIFSGDRFLRKIYWQI
jgi:hypothetical protein